MRITLNSCISLVQIEIHKDKKNYIVEDISNGEFYEMPKVCVIAINHIANGEVLGEIEKTLKQVYTNEDVDLINFAEQLMELGLIDSVDGKKIIRKHIVKKQDNFLWIPSKVGGFFFNRLSIIAYFLLFLIVITLFLLNPSIFPHYKDIFVFDVMSLNVLLWMFFSFVLVLVHEFGHILAMRAYNLPTRIDIGHRLFFIVLETDMSYCWKLAPKERNILFLAGLCFDMLFLFAAQLTQLLLSSGYPFLNGLIALVTFDIFRRVIFQFCIFMKTDLYYVLENTLGSYNLMENANKVLRNWLLLKKAEIEFNDEIKPILFYSIFYPIGVLIIVFIYLKFYVPEILFAANKLLPGFNQPLSNLAFWDATLFSLQIGITLLLLVNSWRKKYLQD